MNVAYEAQLRQEISDAWRQVDKYKRAAQVYAAERDQARARCDRVVKILTAIHALLYPPRLSGPDGRTIEFRSPILHEQMQELSDRIRAIPDDLADATQAGAAMTDSQKCRDEWIQGRLRYDFGKQYEVWMDNGEVRRVRSGGSINFLRFTDCTDPLQNAVCDLERVLAWRPIQEQQ